MGNKRYVKYVFFICLMIINVLALLYIYSPSFSNVEIIINGKKDVTINMNDNYNDEGAYAVVDNVDTSNVITVGEVDTSIPGKYTIEYQYEEGFTTISETRTVIVVDNIKPEIYLKGKETIQIYQYDEFRDPGVSVSDNFDTDLSNNITVENKIDNSVVGTYEIIYTVHDSAGNEASITRTVEVVSQRVNRDDGPRNTKGIPILMYHFFYENDSEYSKHDGYWMSKNKFEAQMKYLSENNYYFPSWLEIEDYIDGKITLPEKSVVVTIDDGDRTFINIAIPILEKYNIKATSFAVGAWTATELSENYRSKNLSIESHSFDAHYVTENGHGRLLDMTYEELLDDTSKVKNTLGTSTVYAYPYGSFNESVINALKEEGYHLGISTIDGRVTPGCDKFSLPRKQVSREINLSTFIKKVS